MEEGYDSDVFVSHNRSQKPWARTLVARLREEGLAVFFDEDSIEAGEDIVRSLETGLRTSRYIALILSPDAVASAWVALEWSSSVYADPDAKTQHIIPVLREDCEIPFILR